VGGSVSAPESPLPPTGARGGRPPPALGSRGCGSGGATADPARARAPSGAPARGPWGAGAVTGATTGEARPAGSSVRLALAGASVRSEPARSRSRAAAPRMAGGTRWPATGPRVRGAGGWAATCVTGSRAWMGNPRKAGRGAAGGTAVAAVARPLHRPYHAQPTHTRAWHRLRQRLCPIVRARHIHTRAPRSTQHAPRTKPRQTCTSLTLGLPAQTRRLGQPHGPVPAVAPHRPPRDCCPWLRGTAPRPRPRQRQQQRQWKQRPRWQPQPL
jgi:hypothetical protein